MRISKLAFIIIEGAMIVAITILHYTTPTLLNYWHELFKVLYFLPIILAAYQAGLAGGLICAFIVACAYLPHVIFQWGGEFLPNLSRFLMIGLYFFIGGLSGYLWQNERRERLRYQKTAEDLQKSILQLEQETIKRNEIENQLLASERLVTLGELTANLAHEVRNPLGSIRGVAEILRDESGNDHHRKFVDILLKEVQRLDHVVANYLTFAKSKSVAKQLIKIQPIWDSVLVLLGSEIRRRQIKMHTRIEPADLGLYCDEIQIRQAFLNISLNAIAASRDGGDILLKAKNEKGSIIIILSDNGQGLSPAALENMFKPFFTTKPEGTGLGLAITKRIVENHSGKISAVNNDHGGTDIILEFPSQNEYQEHKNINH